MNIKKLKTDQRIVRGCLAVILLGIIAISIYCNPDNYSISNCAFKELTGYSCPSCGLTHSFHAGANLHIIKAFSFHLLGPILLLGCLLIFIKFSIESISGKTVIHGIVSSLVKIGILITALIWIAYWIVRLIGEIQ